MYNIEIFQNIEDQTNHGTTKRILFLIKKHSEDMSATYTLV